MNKNTYVCFTSQKESNQIVILIKHSFKNVYIYCTFETHTLSTPNGGLIRFFMKFRFRFPFGPAFSLPRIPYLIISSFRWLFCSIMWSSMSHEPSSCWQCQTISSNSRQKRMITSTRKIKMSWWASLPVCVSWTFVAIWWGFLVKQFFTKYK